MSQTKDASTQTPPETRDASTQTSTIIYNNNELTAELFIPKNCELEYNNEYVTPYVRIKNRDFPQELYTYRKDIIRKYIKIIMEVENNGNIDYRLRNCFGSVFLESGHNRVPDPPQRITEKRLFTSSVNGLAYLEITIAFGLVSRNSFSLNKS